MAGYLERLLVKQFGKGNLYKLFTLITRKKPPLIPLNGALSIKLTRRWDSFPDPKGERISYFAGRSGDVDKLKNWIIYSDGGSVLVRGFRGIGKTAFVYQSISESSHQLGEGKILFIPVNFSEDFGKSPDLDISKESLVLTRIILSLKQIDNESPEIDELYKLAISSESELKAEESKSYVFSVDLSHKVALGAIFSTLGLLTSQIIFKNTLPSLLQNPLTPLALLLFPSGFFAYRWVLKKNETTIKKILLNNPNYLSLKLKKVLDESDFVLVFVVDELDKFFIENTEDNSENAIKKINEIVRRLKYLFTLSQARFIFIVHEAYPHWKEKANERRPEESTYFNWDIFLTGLSLQEIKMYFNQIKMDDLNDDAKVILDDFIHYISFESERIFSEINQLLRDFIVYKNGDPYLKIDNMRAPGSSGSSKMKLAVIEEIMNNVLAKEEGVESTPRQKELYNKTYLILRKASGDILQNRFVAGRDLSDRSVNALIEYYSAKTIADLLNIDFVCFLSNSEKDSIRLKLREFFLEMQKNAFVEAEGKIFFDENNTNDTPINSSLSFEDIDTTGRPSLAGSGLPLESQEFKNSVEEFKKTLANIKSALNINDDIEVATSVFGDDGVSMLSAISLADKINPVDYRTHHLEEIRKLKIEQPNIFESLSVDPISRLKNWIIYNLPGSVADDIIVRKKSIGFRIGLANSSVFIFDKSYSGVLNKTLQNDIKKSLIILLNSSKVNLSYGVSRRRIPSSKVTINLDTLEGANNVLEAIRNKHITTYSEENNILTPGSIGSHFASFIDLDKGKDKSLITEISFALRSLSNYWRAGILIGQNSTDNYEPLGDTGFPLIHLHKNPGESVLRLTAYSNGSHPPDIAGKDLQMNASENVEFRLVIAHHDILRIFVNSKPVYNGIINVKLLEKASILAWGDGNPEFTDIEISNISYTRIT